MNVTIIFQLITAIVLFSITVYLLFANLKSRHQGIYYFMLTTFCYGIFHSIYLISLLFFTEDPIVFGLFYAFGHLFIFLALGFLATFSSSIIFPNITKYVLGIAICASIVFSVVFILNAPTEFKEVEDSLFLPKLTSLGDIALQVNGTGIGLFGLVMFVIAFIKATTKQSRLKAALFAIGFVVIEVAGPMHNFVTTSTGLMLADFFNLVGIVLLLVGILIPKVLSENESSKTPEPVTS